PFNNQGLPAQPFSDAGRGIFLQMSGMVQCLLFPLIQDPLHWHKGIAGCQLFTGKAADFLGCQAWDAFILFSGFYDLKIRQIYLAKLQDMVQGKMPEWIYMTGRYMRKTLPDPG
ncbi:MAG: hypothetical protein LC657_18885, partial [Desulfobacteraceae bacterium]|nr:hypothetical protein [Desulfobacteraceae bacterium]